MTRVEGGSRGQPGAGGKGPLSVLAIGDAVLDVVVELSRTPVVGDDVPARISLSNGGQASNVASWCSALGAKAAVISRVGGDLAGQLVAGRLERQGVVLLGPSGPGGEDGATGVIVSLVTAGGERSMASDRGASAGIAVSDLDPAWFLRCDWLHVSGYSLFAPAGPAAATAAAEMARAAGARVSVDLSAATLVESVGSGEAIRRVEACRPEVVFGNEAEHEAIGVLEGVVTVVKRGPEGFVVRDPGGSVRWPALPVPEVRDSTGAGDAFAAGWIVGGPELARAAAAECLAHAGAMPRAGAAPRVRESLAQRRGSITTRP